LCQLLAEAESSALGSAGSFNDPVYLLGAQAVGALLFGFLPDDSEDLGLRDREAYIIPDAEEHRAWAAALLYDKGSALVLHPAKKPAEICPRV
jgi:hypothetical protein